MNGYVGKPIEHVLNGGPYNGRVITPVENGAYIAKDELRLGNYTYRYGFTTWSGIRHMMARSLNGE